MRNRRLQSRPAWYQQCGPALIAALALAISLALPFGGRALAAESAPAAPAAATQLHLALKLLPQSHAVGDSEAQARGEQDLEATAQLNDAAGEPLRGVEIQFIRRTTFGALLVDTQKTDFAGSASTILPAYPGQAVQVTAKFAGITGLAPSQDVESVSLPDLPPARHLGMFSQAPSPLHLTLLLVVVGGVWATYGYAFHLVRQVRKAGAPTSTV
mgnify:CR=1 FL=1